MLGARQCLTLTLVAPSRGATAPSRGVTPRCWNRGVRVGGMRRGVEVAFGPAGIGVTGGALPLAFDERASRDSKAGSL